MSHIIKIVELPVLSYLDCLIRDEIREESSMYNYVLNNGQSNIVKLNYMLKDVDRFLFDRFCESVYTSLSQHPVDENGNEIDREEIKLQDRFTIKEHIEFIKNHSYYKTCDKSEQDDLLKYVRGCHKDLIIEKKSVFFHYKFGCKYVLLFRDIIFKELERLRQKLDNAGDYTKMPQLELPGDLLDKMEANKLIKKNPLKWLKSKSLLAYFVDVANEKLNLKYGQKRLIKPFEMMFNISGLAGCISEYKNKTGQYPQGYKDIDNLFV